MFLAFSQSATMVRMGHIAQRLPAGEGVAVVSGRQPPLSPSWLLVALRSRGWPKLPSEVGRVDDTDVQQVAAGLLGNSATP